MLCLGVVDVLTFMSSLGVFLTSMLGLGVFLTSMLSLGVFFNRRSLFNICVKRTVEVCTQPLDVLYSAI